MAANLTTTQSTLFDSVYLPPRDSITIGEINCKLIYIQPKESKEKDIINNFIAKNGKIFRSILIPTKYFKRYSSQKQIQKDDKINSNFVINYFLKTINFLSKYTVSSWNISSPLTNIVYSNKLIIKHNPTMSYQHSSSSSYNDQYSMIHSNADRSNDLIKFDYHPLYNKIIIAFKNGIIFFDCSSNCFLPNTLQNPLQTDITDFAFSNSGHFLAVACSKGLFLWELGNRNSINNGPMFSGTLIESLYHGEFTNIIFSPCDKYMAIYRKNGYKIDIYDVYTNKLLYSHSSLFKITHIDWIPSTKYNNFNPLRLLFITNLSKIFILDMISFKTETFSCKTSNNITHCCVSSRGMGLIVVADDRYLYYISLKQFCEPRRLADLYLNFDPKNVKDAFSQLAFDDDKDDEEKKEDKEQTTEFYVKSIKWSPCDRRLGVLYYFKDSEGNKCDANFASIWAYDFSTTYRLGFITHPHNVNPLQVTFRNHFKFGALAAICWSNAFISQHHLCFGTKFS